jgi:UDP-glucuronate decarboxylase
VSDLVDGLVAMMNSADQVTGPINLGNPDEFTMLELAEKIIAMTGSRSKLERRPLPPDDPRQRQPDIGLARSTLSWQPKVPLDEGLRQTIDYFDRLLGTDAA